MPVNAINVPKVKFGVINPPNSNSTLPITGPEMYPKPANASSRPLMNFKQLKDFKKIYIHPKVKYLQEKVVP